MAKRHRHPHKDIEDAVRYAESVGWTFVKKGTGHCWGRLLCPLRALGGCQLSIWSTPRDPVGHARMIRRRVDSCPH